MSGVGIRLIVRGDGTTQTIYFTTTGSGSRIAAEEPGALEKMLSAIAHDALQDYVRNAFEEMQELIADAAQAIGEDLVVNVALNFDLLEGWTQSVEGLHPGRELIFEKLEEIETYLVERFRIEPRLQASRADVLATTSSGP